MVYNLLLHSSFLSRSFLLLAGTGLKEEEEEEEEKGVGGAGAGGGVWREVTQIARGGNRSRGVAGSEEPAEVDPRAERVERSFTWRQ